MDIKAHLKKICDAPGPSGYEMPVRELIAEAWRPMVDSLEVGKLGSLVGLKRGTQQPADGQPRRRIMLSAHMDEIGLIVTGIKGNFVKITRISGVDERAIAGRPVIIHGREPVPGVIGLRPFYSVPSDQNGRYATFDELFVDVGLPEDEINALISIGDVITLDAPMINIQGNRVIGKAIDNRASVAAVSACLDALQGRKHVWDVLAIASTQEEVGGHGARSEAYRLNPDLAIALDVSFASQPGVNDGAFKLGDAPPLSLGANFHPALYDAILEAAARIDMKLPLDPTPAASGTDAWPIQISRDGIPTALLNLPIRNMHSTVELIDMRDIERCGRVMAEFIAGLQPDFLATIVWDKAKEK